jgi:hypothetical protein
MIKSDKDLKKTIDNLRRERYIKGLDPEPVPYNEVLHAAFRFEPLMDILKKAEFVPRNKKAQGSFSIFSFIIFSFLVVVFFAGLIWSMNLINDVMHQVGLDNEVNAGQIGYTNMTLASDQIFGSQAESIKALRMVSIVYILGLAAVIILTNVFVRKHPILFFANILISVLAIIFAPPISNAYENLLNSGIYDGGLTEFTASNFILLNLPTIVLIIAVLGGLLSFINLIRNQDTDTNL